MKLFRIVFITILCIASQSTAANNKTVLIIQSSENTFFTSTINSVKQQTRPAPGFQVTTLKALQQDESPLQQAAYIITLGLNAADYVHRSAPHITALHSYITEFQSHQHEPSPHHHIILLDQPLQRYLNFIKLLLGVKNIGIIRKKANALQPAQIQALNSALDIQLEQRLFETGNNPVNSVRTLLQTNDVLLSLPEPDVYNRNTLKGILLTSYRQKKPVISYSPSQVKSGALAALFASPEDIGQQLAGLLNKLLADKQFKPESVYYASDFDITYNMNVANSLGLILPDREELLRKLRLDQPE